MNAANRALVLGRIHDTADGTLGFVQNAEGDVLVAATLELAWRDNHPDTSRVPAGTYAMRRAMHHPGTPGEYEVFELVGVPGRSNIQLHIGNTPENSLGCILLGSSYASFGSEQGVADSTDAFKAFMAAMQGIDDATLTITDPPSPTGGAPDV